MKKRPQAVKEATAEVSASAVDHKPVDKKVSAASELDQYNVRLPKDLVTEIGVYVAQERSSRQEVTRIALEEFLASRKQK